MLDRWEGSQLLHREMRGLSAYLSPLPTVVAHGDERLERVPPQSSPPMNVRETRGTKSVAALIAILDGHLVSLWYKGSKDPYTAS